MRGSCLQYVEAWLEGWEKNRREEGGEEGGRGIDSTDRWTEDDDSGSCGPGTIRMGFGVVDSGSDWLCGCFLVYPYSGHPTCRA